MGIEKGAEGRGPMFTAEEMTAVLDDLERAVKRIRRLTQENRRCLRRIEALEHQRLNDDLADRQLAELGKLWDRHRAGWRDGTSSAESFWAERRALVRAHRAERRAHAVRG